MGREHKRGWFDWDKWAWEDARPGESDDPEHRWPYCYCGLYADKCPDLLALEAAR